MSSQQLSSATPGAPFDQRENQPATDAVKRSRFNGTNRAVALGHVGLFTGARSVNGGSWIPLSRISQTETDSFHRLIARVCAGEIDPREQIADGTCSRDIRLVAVPE
jgi:hypothetical protein